MTYRIRTNASPDPRQGLYYWDLFTTQTEFPAFVAFGYADNEADAREKAQEAADRHDKGTTESEYTPNG